MTDDEIFIKVLQKGIKNGWMPRPDVGANFEWQYASGNFLMRTPFWDPKKEAMAYQMGQCSIEKILFDRAFACAFFGDDSWEANIQQLSICDSRPEFLRQFVDIVEHA